MQQYPKHMTYGFRFKGEHQERVAGLHSIGKEARTEHTYKWDGLKRAENGRVVFQYTLNGEGAIRIGNRTESLKKGDAFLVKIPSDHCYYLPGHSKEWEFVFITTYGEEVLKQFSFITKKHGHLLKLPTHSRPIKHVLRLFDRIETTGINHGYEASGYAYSFIMELLQYVEYVQEQEDSLPVAIAKAVAFIEKNYQRDITLEDMVAVSGLSKYHFTRLFSKVMRITPIRYLTKIRIQHALDLLQQSDRSIEDISRAVGYTSSNYFSKVFKNLLGESPSVYRQSKDYMPVDRLFIE